MATPDVESSVVFVCWQYGSRDREFEGIGSVQKVERCKIVFLWEHFLFSCSDTFAVGCII